MIDARQFFRRLWALAAVVALATVAIGTGSDSATPTADAYSFLRTSGGTKVKWDLSNANGRPNIVNGHVVYLVGVDGCDDAAGFTGAVDEFAAIRKAMETWNEVESSVYKAHYGGGTDKTAINGNDNTNTVFFEKTGRLDSSTFALTTTTFLVASGELVDADVEINDARFTWDTVGERTTGGNNRAFIEHIVAHEGGHFFGLDHSPINRATMIAASPTGAISQASLEAEDRAAVSSSYPAANFSTDFATVRGKVTKNGGLDAFGVGVFAIDVETWAVVVSAITEPNGTYEIAGIPPGEYWLLAAPIRKERFGSFYASVDTNLIPQIHGVATGSAGTPDVYTLAAGDLVTTNVDFALNAVGLPDVLEGAGGNNTAATATALAYGQAVASRLSPANDIDFFSFNAAAGDSIDLIVIAYEAGSAVDAQFSLLESNQTTPLISPRPRFVGDPTVNTQADDVDKTAFDLDGFNFDPRIESYTIPAGKGGTLYWRIDEFGGAPANAWYIAAIVRPASDTAVSPGTSTIALSRGSLAAGSAEMATATVVARNKFGQILPAVAGGVTLTVDAANIAMTETPLNSGTWTAQIAAAGSPGSSTVSAIVGGTQIQQSLALYYTGALDAGASTLVANPTGMFADGASKATVIVTAKDSGGRPIKDNTLTVTIAATMGTLSGVSFDDATGTFRASLTAPTTPGSSTVSASINGNILTQQATVVFDDDPTPVVPVTTDSGGKCGFVPGDSAAMNWAPLLALFAAMLTLSSWRRRP